MPPAAVAVGGAALSYFGSKQDAKNQNKFAQQAADMMNPLNIRRSAGQLNPALFRAMNAGQLQRDPNKRDPSAYILAQHLRPQAVGVTGPQD